MSATKIFIILKYSDLKIKKTNATFYSVFYPNIIVHLPETVYVLFKGNAQIFITKINGNISKATENM